jgi:vacuolar-type H+-ATPase subunit C/Vma6
MFFVPYHPFEGTELAEMAANTGMLVEIDSQDLTSPPYLPGTYESVEQLQQAVVHAYRKYYLRLAYAARALNCCVRRPALVTNYFRAMIDYAKIVRNKGNTRA